MPRGEVKLSKEARQLVKAGIGYRTELAYGEGARLATEVFKHEVTELGNAHMLDELQTFLHLPEQLSLSDALRSIQSIVGKDGRALWLGTKKNIIDLYIRPSADADSVTQHLDRYHIPSEALLISDLGRDGQLFIMPNTAYTRMTIVHH
jgi:hypothetical protein